MATYIQVANDTFASNTIANYDNGPGAYENVTITGGVMRPSATSAGQLAVARRSAETYPPDQSSLVQIGANGNLGAVGVMVRMPSSTTAAGYIGISSPIEGRFAILSSAADGTRTTLAELTSGYAPLSANDFLWLDVIGSTLQLWRKIGAGADELLLEATNSTYTTGQPGIVVVDVSAVTGNTVTEWIGYRLTAAGRLVNSPVLRGLVGGGRVS